MTNLLLKRGTRAALALMLIAVFALLAGAATGAGSAAKPKRAKVQPRPNVIVVMTDDMRQDDMVVMKKVQRLLGTEGTTFENSIASFPLCCPSRATFLTGQYAHNHGVLGNHWPEGGHRKLNHENTLPVWLRRAGYATIHVGKYLNDYGEAPSSPTEIPPGWSEWYGAIGLAYSGGTVNANGTVIRPGKAGGKYSTDIYTDKAVEVVKRRSKSTTPFFLFVGYYAPHAGQPVEPDDPPGLPTPAVADRHRDKFASIAPNRLPSFNAPTPTQSRRPLTAEEIAAIDELREQRLESLLSVDEGVERIIAALPPTERANTVVLFTSDNGFYLGEHRFKFGKVYPYEEALRVPLLIRGPRVPKGARVKSLVANVDVAPTIVGFARAQAGLPMDGRSLAPFFTNPGMAWNRAYLVESTPNALGVPVFAGLRTQRYFYLEYRGAKVPELYDLVQDPYELASLGKSPASAALAAQLGAKMRAAADCDGAACAAVTSQ